MARVWPHNIVEEAALRVHVAALRKALGDGLPGRRYITTVPQRGYAFVAPVRQDPLIHAPACTCGASYVRPPRDPDRLDWGVINCATPTPRAVAWAE
jgi:DNA-binding winged helix-turn-helix (wHTH) protein